jgi:hypothetical protein
MRYLLFKLQKENILIILFGRYLASLDEATFKTEFRCMSVNLDLTGDLLLFINENSCSH